ncbi:hypothetical protein KVG88_19070 [Pseudomonas sp. SWRI74]|uniref:Uncharacterized protein n=1 Tax=Pseudomonas azerbaijanoccidentalis TaxID=2842347 RepID=A0ABS6QTA3_9PSED|nr:hypothetical protein [Pseudomonas azerbaijanoccidentalis]MBV4522167.1 hypothetical protein [Pseudomonas azerbaijanoccidentalis]
MAKITITFEDCRDEQGKPSVNVDMAGVPTTAFGQHIQTAAVRMYRTVFDLVAGERILGSIPACRLQPSTQTLH